MDKALLLHSTDEIFIIKFQKKIIEEAGRKGICVSPFFPVFCPLGGFEFFDGFKPGKTVLEIPEIKRDGIYIPVSFFIDGNSGKKRNGEQNSGNLNDWNQSSEEEKSVEKNTREQNDAGKNPGEKCSFPIKIAVFLGENKNASFSDFEINSEDFLFPRGLKRFRIADYEKTGFETKFYNEKWFKM